MSLKPRTAKAKAAKVERSNSANGSRLVVKFNDDVRLRTLPNGRLLSLTGKDITSLEELVMQNAVMLEPMSQLPQERLDSIINRAELNSGRAQPDIAGMYYVYGFEADVDNAAREFLAHEDVEFASFQGMDGFTATNTRIAAEQTQRTPIAATTPTSITEPGTILAAAPMARKPQINRIPSSSNNDSPAAKPGKTGSERGACCTDDGCENLTMDDCRSIGGAYRGAFTHCDSGICTTSRALFGACCFQDETSQPITLATALALNDVDLSSIPGAFDPDAASPGNPYVVRTCVIVQDVGNPVDEGYQSVGEVCGELQGTLIPGDCSSDLCGNFGGCCTDGDCENRTPRGLRYGCRCVGPPRCLRGRHRSCG